MLEINLVVITLGSFAAAFFNAAFATGGIHIMLATAASVLPISIAIPLTPALMVSSLIARVMYFWTHINWPITGAFIAGSVIGVYIGTKVFIALDEAVISLLLGIVLIVLIWMPNLKMKWNIRQPFFYVGTLHSFMGTVFGVGAFLQPAILRTPLLKAQLNGTIAACLITMEVFRIAGYSLHGFDYAEYIPHILGAAIAGFIGTFAGKRFMHVLSEQTFRLAFKWLVTLVGLRLIYKGLMLW